MLTQFTTARCVLAIALVFTLGCNQRSANPQSGDSPVVAEGVIYSLEYKLENGRTGGFTRLNVAGAVPGGNGSWNVDATGRLTNQYLIITYPQKLSLGPRIIPAHRLVDLQFGNGGIETVHENGTAAGE